MASSLNFKPDTKGLKAGNYVVYNDGRICFPALVIEVTATTKARIRPLEHVDDDYNPKHQVNTYRRWMAIIRDPNVLQEIKELYY